MESNQITLFLCIRNSAWLEAMIVTLFINKMSSCTCILPHTILYLDKKKGACDGKNLFIEILEKSVKPAQSIKSLLIGEFYLVYSLQRLSHCNNRSKNIILHKKYKGNALLL